MRVSFELRGLTAMLQHKDDIEMADRLDQWRKDPRNKGISKAGDDRSPAWTWQSCLYHDGKHISMASENIMVCLRQAGAQMILKKQKTFKEISQSGMSILTEFCEFTTGGRQISMHDIIAIRDMSFEQQADACRELGFRLWCKRAKIGTSKHIRVRPRFDDWAIRGELLVVAPELTLDAVRQLFDLAGRVGLCDWRPGCKTPGPFGMFEAIVSQVG